MIKDDFELKQFTLEYGKQLQPILHDKSVWKYLTDKDVLASDMYVEYVLHCMSEHTKDAFVIVDKISTHAIGYICFDTDIEYKSATLGFLLDPTYKSNGLMTGSLLALIPYVSKKHNIQHMNADTAEPNIGSHRVLEKCGFTLIRRIANDLKCVDGVETNFVYYKFVGDGR